MNYIQSVLEWFNHLDVSYKRSMIFFAGCLVFSCAGFSWYALSPSYAVLFNQLDARDASTIINQLEHENIAFQLQNNGHDILVDKNLIEKTRLKVMSHDMPFAGSIGFELFDKNDFSMSDFSQRINYQRALQGELERTISSFDEIRFARVHLIIPENHLFAKEEHQPKAAITLNLKNTLSIKQVKSIQRLVSASVAHLKSTEVVVVDQNGNTLSSSTEDNTLTHFSTKKNIELYLNTKVTQMLHRIFPKHQVVVKIDAAINYDELQRERINPQNKGSIKHEKEINHSISSKAEKEKTSHDITLEKDYALGSEKELFKRARGTIERLSISVVLPSKTLPETIHQIERLVKSTVGFNERRGDIINVEALIIEPQSFTPITPSITHETEMPAYDKTIVYCVLILFFMITSTGILVLKKIRHKKRQLLLIELTQWLTQHD